MHLDGRPPQGEPQQHPKKAKQYRNGQPRVVNQQRRRHAPQHADNIDASQRGVPRGATRPRDEASGARQHYNGRESDVNQVRGPIARQLIKAVGVLEALSGVKWHGVGCVFGCVLVVVWLFLWCLWLFFMAL